MDANVFRQLGGGFRQRNQWIRKGALEEGGRIATVLNCPNINKLVDWREQVSRCLGIERSFAGETVVSLEWEVFGKQWHTPVKG